MGRGNSEDGKLYNPFIMTGLRLLSMEWAPADNEVLDPDAPPWLIMNPAGAIDILMPTSSAALKGLCFLISNISASTITLKTDGDAAFTTAIVLATMESAWVMCTGSTTQALGWRGTATAAST